MTSCCVSPLDNAFIHGKKLRYHGITVRLVFTKQNFSKNKYILGMAKEHFQLIENKACIRNKNFSVM